MEWYVEEGEMFEPIKRVATVRGQAHNLLLGERVALNLLARASGIAARARRLNAIKASAGWHGAVAGTRKTTPGARVCVQTWQGRGGAKRGCMTPTCRP